MTLATRCPACGTVFRVVPDQLKISDGWVRCGRCAEVFDASGALIDLDAPAAAIVAPPKGAAAITGVVAHAPAPAANDEAAAPDGQAAPAAEASAAAARDGPAVAAPGEPTARASAMSETAQVEDAAVAPVSAQPAAAGTAAAEPADAAHAGAASAAAAPAASVPASAGPPAAAPPATAPAAADAAKAVEAAAPADSQPETPVPGFVRRAERADRWRSPRRRALLGALALALGATLAAQIGLHYRDLIAATWPETRPALQAACTAVGCRVEPPRRIDDLSVESSALLRVEGTALHRLQVVVRNRGTTEARMPAVELSLTDTIGRTVARRVFDARELGVAAPSLPPRGEAALAAMLALDDVKVAGYTVELFYP